MFFIREVKYLYYYEKSKKCCSAGTCKCQMRDDKMVLDVCLKRLPLYYPLQAKMYFTAGTDNQVMEQGCELLQEKQEYRFIFSYSLKEADCEKLYFFFRLSSDKVICDEKTLFEYVTKKDTTHQRKKLQEQSTSQEPEQELQREPESEPELYAASGQSLVHIPNIHGQKETYYVAEPKQLKRFGKGFSQYEDNSFLLHGYYNYRHILVGPATETGGGIMRIGVPGNYYKREEVVAKMFGFLDFVPAKGERKTGAFGYYYTSYLPLENERKKNH